MPLKRIVRIVVCVVVWFSVAQALYVMLPMIPGIKMILGNLSGNPNVEKLAAGFLALVFTISGFKIIDKRVCTALMNGDEREYLDAAWLAGVFGLVLMSIEAASELVARKCFKLEFIFEDLLLGVSALCVLSEEVRLLRAAMNAAGVLKVGPGFDRIIIPPPRQKN